MTTMMPWPAPAPGSGMRGAADKRAAVHGILAKLGEQLADGAAAEEVMPRIRHAVSTWAIRQAGHGLPGDAGEQEELAQAVYDERYGLGPLEELLRQPGVENIDLNGAASVWLTYSTGERAQHAPVFADDGDMVATIRRLAERAGHTARMFTESTPMVEIAVSGVRITATMMVTPQPCVSVRRHRLLDVDLNQLIELGTLTPATAGLLAAAVKARLNIVFTGAQGAGKTTLLRAAASQIAPHERIATMESARELYLHELPGHPDVISLEERQANSEGVGAITLRDLFPQVLRHNAPRILVGEVRQGEIVAMLEAMNSGADGSMCTLHADSPDEAFDRILILALARGGLVINERALHMLVGMAVDLIVHIHARHDGHRTVRYVSEILEVMPPADAERPSTNKIFVPGGPAGTATPSGITPSRKMLDRLEAAGMDIHLLDSPMEIVPGARR
jgi:Flp pilus assembly CpaF family ATPase